VRPLLGKSDAELASWRDALHEALGPNGRLMVDVVPELKLIVGEQPPVPELPRSRHKAVFSSCSGASSASSPARNIRWRSFSTICSGSTPRRSLLEDLLTRSDLQHLMLIGAYRTTRLMPLIR